MKREILFRAKRIDDNNWVYGSLIVYSITKDGKEKQYAIKLQDAYNTDLDTYRVISETIGQFTGLTDKNGVKIFEGDKTNYGTVLFKYGCFGIDGNNGFVEISNWNLSHIEIIGNIHNANV